MKMTIDNYRGALLGLAVGDALGATTENMWEKDIKKKYGTLTEIIGGGWLKLPVGHVTDDTDMTVALANGILKADKSKKKSATKLIDFIGKEFIDWYLSNPVDVGSTTGLAIGTFLSRKMSWDRAGMLAHKMLKQSAGNGSLMRCLPVALTYWDDPQKMELITDAQSAMTHFDSLAAEACLIYNRTAVRIINGEDLKKALKTELKGTRYADIIKKRATSRPSGYVVDTFEWVIRIILTSDSYEEIIVRLANKGSDSDSTAAIAGGLAGLYYGLEAIPERLASKIIRKDEILKTADALFELATRIEGATA